MYNFTAVISPKGQVLLPKEIRNVLSASVVNISTIDNKVVITPIQDVAGILAKFQQDTNLSLTEIRDQSWTSATQNKK